MIRAHDIGEYAGFGKAVDEGGGQSEVIDSPSNVALSRAAAVRPPGIGLCPVGMQVAVGVDEAAFQKLGETCALLVGKAGTFSVR